VRAPSIVKLTFDSVGRTEVQGSTVVQQSKQQFIQENTKASVRYEVLDSWRGICAICVVLGHFQFATNLSSQFLDDTGLFVDFFFVLSGFVITHTYAHRIQSWRSLASFAIRRFGRLWPLNVAVLPVFWLVWTAQNVIWRHGLRIGNARIEHGLAISNTAWSYISAVFLLQATPLHWTYSPDGPSWSISVEFWTYLVFGFVVLISSRYGRLSGRVAASAATIIIVVCYVLLYFIVGQYGTYFNYAIARCSAGFFVGYLGYSFTQTRWHDRYALRKSHATIAELIALGLIGVYVAYTGDSHADFLAPIVFISTIILFAQEKGVVSRLMMLRPFTTLGRLSFSIYMVHWFVLDSLFVLQGGGLTLFKQLHPTAAAALFSARPFSWEFLIHSWPGTVILVAITVVMAFITHIFVEEPTRKLSGRIAQLISRSS
jgi:peptidoglycan/LPS O-acetylase OafA/YrhL